MKSGQSHESLPHLMSDEHRIEELAEEMWSLSERDQNERSRLIAGSKLGREVAETVLAEMDRRGMVKAHGDRIVLLPAGEGVARAVIRRHRLAEVLLGQILAVAEEDTEHTACQVEHILSAEVTDRICTFLGHPPVCPHGKPIPRGDCCAAFQKEVRPLVQPLSTLPIGRQGRIVFITPALYRRLDRLVTLGLEPGGRVRLQQNHPAVIVQIGETSVALDREICGEIYVLPLEQ
ncbi:MAG: metal-dependent transcriptional regulator [Acidobacteriota bacterium]